MFGTSGTSGTCLANENKPPLCLGDCRLESSGLKPLTDPRTGFDHLLSVIIPQVPDETAYFTLVWEIGTDEITVCNQTEIN